MELDLRIVESGLILLPMVSDHVFDRTGQSAYLVGVILPGREGRNCSIFLCLRPMEDLLILRGVV
jgi:hypothetical protein